MSPNFQLQDTQKVPYRLVALDADGNQATLPTGASVDVSSSDSGMANVVADPTPADGAVASGMIVGGTKLGTVQINATVTNQDGSTGPTGAVAVDVVSGPAASISISLGAAVPQL